MFRTITEILKDADETTDLQEIINLWNEIANNKKQYHLTEIAFANEYLRERCFTCNGQDIDKGKFYIALKAQCPNRH